jgi:hypothetical protein
MRMAGYSVRLTSKRELGRCWSVRYLTLVRRDELEEGSAKGARRLRNRQTAEKVESVAMYPPAKTQRRHRRDYSGAAIGIYLCAFCALVGCFFVGLYELMQPTQYPNPGLAAYKSAPTVAYVPQSRIRNEGEPSVMQEFASAIEPGPETATVRDTVPLPKASLPKVSLPKKAEKPHRKIATVVSKRPSAVRERRDAAPTIIDLISANNRTAGY